MPTLIPWRSPRTELRDRLDTWFDQLFADPFGRSWLADAPANGHREVAFLPPVEVREADEQVLVRAELPGVDAKEVEVELNDGVLVLAGKKEDRQERKEGDHVFSEFRFGAFRREIHLPADVEPDSVRASCENGILTVEMQKAKSSRPLKIKVEGR